MLIFLIWFMLYVFRYLVIFFKLIFFLGVFDVFIFLIWVVRFNIGGILVGGCKILSMLFYV